MPTAQAISVAEDKRRASRRISVKSWCRSFESLDYVSNFLLLTSTNYCRITWDSLSFRNFPVFSTLVIPFESYLGHGRPLVTGVCYDCTSWVVESLWPRGRGVCLAPPGACWRASELIRRRGRWRRSPWLLRVGRVTLVNGSCFEASTNMQLSVSAQRGAASVRTSLDTMGQ